jgi:hypothetical protein
VFADVDKNIFLVFLQDESLLIEEKDLTLKLGTSY